jgi:hypothetical protein
VLGWSTGNSNSQDSSQPRLGGSHHLPPYSILCAFPQGPHPNGILYQDSQVGVLKFSSLGLPWLWGPITFSLDLRLRWGLKKSCSPHRDLFNSMWHAACTKGNWVDSWLLMVGSQIANLIPSPSFDHSLCFRCPNGSCEIISNIYVSRAFQWYNERLNPINFYRCNCSLKIWKSVGT